jgi:hypothetical protein
MPNEDTVTYVTLYIDSKRNIRNGIMQAELNALLT